MKTRHQHIIGSNNKRDPNKNVCALHVAAGLGCASQVKYLHTWSDLKRAISKRFSCRSVRSKVKGDTVGAIRSGLKGLDAIAFVVMVDSHVLLLDTSGKTVVDTAPRAKDRRKVKAVYAVYKKPTRKSRRIIALEKAIARQIDISARELGYI